jgi:ribonucleoside-diphosphate reductase alpha chain
MLLQHGVPLDNIVRKYMNQSFEPQGMTENPEIPFAKSIIDYLARYLGNTFISGFKEMYSPKPVRVEPVIDVNNRLASILVPRKEKVAVAADATVMAKIRESTQNDAPCCGTCGAMMRRKGACYSCDSCGSTSGCG